MNGVLLYILVLPLYYVERT